MLTRSIAWVSGIATGSGILVLLGWFTAPVRLLVLVLVGARIAWSALRYARRVPWRRARSWSAEVAVVALCAAGVSILVASGTTDPIRSPWSITPNPFLITFGLLVLMAVILAFQNRPIGALIGVASTLGLGSLVAILVYRLGFGFDHFLHAAAEGIILAQGDLSPPPYFYSAHYSLATLLATTGIPIAITDRILVPLLAVTLLVPLVYQKLRCTTETPRAALLGTSSLLIVPFLPLAVSTPQALSAVFVLTTILLLTGYPRYRSTAAIASIAALLANPLSGIPLIAAGASVIAFQHRRRIVGILFAVSAVIALPVALHVATAIIPGIELTVRVSSDRLAILPTAVAALLSTKATDLSTADALSVLRVALPVIWCGFALVGARLLWKRNRSAAVAPITMIVVSIGAATATLLTTTLGNQLAEEQTDFPIRLLSLAALVAVPLAGVSIGSLADRLRGHAQRLAYALLIAAAATFTLLLAYPRDDAQERSGLWSVSADDIAAVHRIAEDAGDTPFVVLANQMLGAAAIREFGFRPVHIICREAPRASSSRSISAEPRVAPTLVGAEWGDPSPTPATCHRTTEVLSFPLPAGGPIAQQFAAYVSADEPTGAPIRAAMDLVGARRAYVVIHTYWRGAERLMVATEHLTGPPVHTLDHLRIFRFTKN